jgi:hypothetical protein
VLLEVRGNGGAVLWSQTVTATSCPGSPGSLPIDSDCASF